MVHRIKLVQAKYLKGKTFRVLTKVVSGEKAGMYVLHKKTKNLKEALSEKKKIKETYGTNAIIEVS